MGILVIFTHKLSSQLEPLPPPPFEKIEPSSSDSAVEVPSPTENSSPTLDNDKTEIHTDQIDNMESEDEIPVKVLHVHFHFLLDFHFHFDNFQSATSHLSAIFPHKTKSTALK